MGFVNYEKRNRVAIVTMNRPERLNAYGRQMALDLREAWSQFLQDQEARVAILTGAGRAFCAGVDAKEWAEGKAFPREGIPEILGTPQFSKPVVAAIHGYCLGAGLNMLAMRCDLRIAAQSALFGLPEVARGVVVKTVPLAYQNIPTCLLMELALTGDNITAQRAYEIGLVNRVVPDAELMPVALQVAERIAEHSPLAVQLTKRALLKAVEPSEAAMILEEYLFKESSRSEDAIEGMQAFAEKRSPQWKGP